MNFFYLCHPRSSMSSFVFFVPFVLICLLSVFISVNLWLIGFFMNYNEFQQRIDVTKELLYREIYQANRERIQVKKEATVIRNLSRIFDAALKIGNQHGFQGMSMRDFSKETGLSMGALYSYFASKDELLDMILRQGRRLVLRILEEQLDAVGGPVEKLETAIRTHLFLSEALQPWFYLSFMEK